MRRKRVTAPPIPQIAKSPVHVMTQATQTAPSLTDRAIAAAAKIEEAIDEAFDAMWGAEDDVNRFHARSAADLRLKAGFLIDHMYCDQSAEHGSDIFAWNVLRELVGRTSLPAVRWGRK